MRQQGGFCKQAGVSGPALLSHQMDAVETPLRPAPAEPVLLKPNTKGFLTAVGLVPADNFAETHCWWVAVSSHIGVDLLTAMLKRVVKPRFQNDFSDR